MSNRPRLVYRAAAGPALLAVILAAAALGVGAPVQAAEDPGLDQKISDDQRISTEKAVLAEGHVDIGPRYVDGEWTLLVHDDSAEPPVWRPMDTTVFQIGDAALLTVPDNPDYSFLPAPVGDDVHVVPQAQQPDVVWVGWNTQDPEVMATIDRGATLSLRGVEGPGEMVMFLQSGTLGAPDVLWDSREAYPQDIWVDVNTHTHANWAFSEPGVYLVEVEVAADLVTGERESDIEVLRFAVGAQTGPDDALAAEYVPAETAPGDASAAPGQGNEGSTSGLPTALPIAVAVALATVLLIVLLRGRGAKRRAEAERASPDGLVPDGSPKGQS